MRELLHRPHMRELLHGTSHAGIASWDLTCGNCFMGPHMRELHQGQAIEQMVKTLTSLSQEGGGPYILYIYIIYANAWLFFLVTGGQFKAVTDQGCDRFFW